MRAPERGRDLCQIVDDEQLNVEILQLDITDNRSVRAAVDTIISGNGRIDAVVNNAGVGPSRPSNGAPTKSGWRRSTRTSSAPYAWLGRRCP
jgi:NAD(P)-dependent dehydrogenase (short-subunit alcohol dehydrogenase family)